MKDSFSIKPGFHSNARNARKVLRKKKYISKIKSAQGTQENYARKKQKYTSASHTTDTSGHCVTTEPILFFMPQTQAPANRNAQSKQPIMVAKASACVFRVPTTG